MKETFKLAFPDEERYETELQEVLVPLDRYDELIQAETKYNLLMNLLKRSPYVSNADIKNLLGID